jgi:molybdate/tungstate transport system substrate-binding protein
MAAPKMAFSRVLHAARDASARRVVLTSSFAAIGYTEILLRPGIVVGTSHPFLDPSGYRAHLMAQLEQAHAGVPNLANDLLEHYVATPAAAPANAFALGKLFDFQFTYEHSAQAAAQANPDYRYVYLPDDVDLSNPSKNGLYSQATITMPGLGTEGAEPSVTIPATRTAWGLTILNSAPDRENAIKFVQLLLAPEGAGQSSLRKVGPEPIAPIVSRDDFTQLPAELQRLIKVGDPRAI